MTFVADRHCGGCEQRVTERLEEHEGVRGVHADAGRVDVVFNPRVTSPDDLRPGVGDLGYAVELSKRPLPVTERDCPWRDRSE